MNYVASPSSSSSSGGCTPSADTNVTVETAWNSDGNAESITAKNSTTGDQTTQYVYGTTLSDSLIASSKYGYDRGHKRCQEPNPPIGMSDLSDYSRFEIESEHTY